MSVDPAHGLRPEEYRTIETWGDCIYLNNDVVNNLNLIFLSGEAL